MADIPDYVLHSRMKAQKPGHTCTLIYTSGTTGTPKAVMITHDNITWTAHTLVDWAELNIHKGQEQLISYLPLSHIAAQMVDIHGPIHMGGCTWFAQPDALKGSLPVTLREVRPTIFLG
jgi:long-chain-fatty-acid--CoA ligase ACSBG